MPQYWMHFKASEQLIRRRKRYEKQVESLEVQAATLGKTAEQATLYQLAQRGATEAQLASADAALQQINAFNSMKRVTEFLLDDEDRLRQAFERRRQIILENTAAGSEAQAQMLERLAELYEEQLERFGSTTGKMTAFADQAARNMQDAFADFLFEPFDEGLKGMLESFVNTLRRLAAEAAAAAIFDNLPGGGIGGFVKSVFGGARASGGPVESGASYLVGERGPEFFTPAVAGQITPAGPGSVAVNNVYNVSGTGVSEAEVRAITVEGQAQTINTIRGLFARRR